jgi:hypothetical protein
MASAAQSDTRWKLGLAATLAGDRAHAPPAPVPAGGADTPAAPSAAVRSTTLDAASQDEAGPGPDASRVPVTAGQPKLPPRIGRYLVLLQFGHSGMGGVYFAQDPGPDRKVANRGARTALQSQRHRRQTESPGNSRGIRIGSRARQRAVTGRMRWVGSGAGRDMQPHLGGAGFCAANDASLSLIS